MNTYKVKIEIDAEVEAALKFQKSN